eukprot:7376261-Prymnesium_polylepis.3
MAHDKVLARKPCLALRIRLPVLLDRRHRLVVVAVLQRRCRLLNLAEDEHVLLLLEHLHVVGAGPQRSLCRVPPKLQHLQHVPVSAQREALSQLLLCVESEVALLPQRDCVNVLARLDRSL